MSKSAMPITKVEHGQVTISSLDLLPSLPFAQRKKLPNCRGIYFVRDADNVLLYIGVAESLVLRWLRHHKLSVFKTFHDAVISWLEYDADDLYDLEGKLIVEMEPLLNKTASGLKQAPIIQNQLDKVRCELCGHTWQPRVADPRECPNCKNRKWKVKR